jgi:pimeloyl-ACP methyl ester carboxylesterase
MNFVLIHGGFHGGWCWRPLADRLNALGHATTRPTLTGLGERRHLASRHLSLDVLIDDVVNHLAYEDLSDVVLVGHSFGGLPVSGAAERARERISHLVYLDALILQPGQTPYSVLPPEVVAQRRQSCIETGGVRSFPPPPVTAFGVAEDHPQAAWLRSHLTPQPESLYDSPLSITGPVGNGLPCTYVACTAPVLSAVAGSQAWARQQKHWNWHEMPTGHDAMVTAPDELAALLVRIGRGTGQGR